MAGTAARSPPYATVRSAINRRAAVSGQRRAWSTPRAASVLLRRLATTTALEEEWSPDRAQTVRSLTRATPERGIGATLQAMSAPQNRDGSGRWPRGVSGNPGGRPKGIGLAGIADLTVYGDSTEHLDFPVPEIIPVAGNAPFCVVAEVLNGNELGGGNLTIRLVGYEG
jgi:hypothetical protein